MVKAMGPENYLLDLSMTMMRYKGSSIELDIKFLFENLDERICIGSDFPEYSIQKTKERFIELYPQTPHLVKYIKFYSKYKSNTNQIIPIPHLKDRDKLLSKMISFHKSAV
jgi:hypothetical protein